MSTPIFPLGLATQAPPVTETSDMQGALLALLVGAIQLIASLALFTLAVSNGLKIVSRLIDGLDIWAEIKKRNVAVALLAGGAVIAYTNVVAGGVLGMTKGLTGLVQGEFGAGLWALLGGLFNLVIALLVAGVAISWTFKVMDKWTADIDEKAEFKSGNVAIGVVYAGILIGASALISAGVQGISLAVTQFLDALL
jgi:uncharacterized membrane protein YjfL (UPF0719 family)